MPDLDGINLAQCVRLRHPGVPVVFMSGYAPEQLGPVPGDDGSIFLPKPFSATELLGVLRARLA
jgi:two-component system cell cycle sensor histidine kinase/response regulator CckA